jgi:serine/threonine protein kinase
MLHNKDYVHRDIKPENFCVGTKSQNNVIYMIDFGLARRYRDPKAKIHIPESHNRGLTGTARYASINAHLGVCKIKIERMICKYSLKQERRYGSPFLCVRLPSSRRATLVRGQSSNQA